MSYAYSQVWSIQRGRRIDAGQVQGKFALREAPTTPASEASGLSHDAAGLLSVRRGGGLFDFGITTAPTPEYVTPALRDGAARRLVARGSGANRAANGGANRAANGGAPRTGSA